MQENENYVPYTEVPSGNNTYNANCVPNASRPATLCFSFGIVSICLIFGNFFIGLIFGILSLVFCKKAKKAGIYNSDVKNGHIMGLIGTIGCSIFTGFYLLFIIFYIGIFFFSLIASF